MRLWIDTEFNGYKGELLSMALIDDDGREWYEVRLWNGPLDPWVAANVVPVFGRPAIPLELMRLRLQQFLGAYDAVHVVADWPEDIEHFCALLIVGPGKRIDTPPLTMEVRRDLNTDASLTPHNALADARDLRRLGLMHNDLGNRRDAGPIGGASVLTDGLGGTRFDTQEWLMEALQDGTPRHRRLSFLITANGGLRVGGWGFIGYGNGHQSGLEQNDALELMQWSAFMDGLEAAGVEILAELRPYFEAYQAEFVTPNV